MQREIILVNHVGFVSEAAKYCVIPSAPTAAFAVFELKDTLLTEVFRGALEPGGPELGGGWVGDFSALTHPGIYQIRCGALRSRYFVVHDQAYYWPMHTLFGYFPAQRCGHSPLGWASPCHLQDGIIAETGEQADLTGGWHQSGDLRKWTWGLVLGLLGLSEFGLSSAPRWDLGQVADEIRWGSEYYLKLQRPDGGLMDTINLPLGWGPRQWYRSDSPPTSQWNAIRCQALAARYLRERDPAYAKRCFQAALRGWAYMARPDRPYTPYQPPEIPPRGHDWMSWFYKGMYRGSAIDWGHRLCAALALHGVAVEQGWLDEAAKAATELVALQLGNTCEARNEAAACFWEGPEGDTLANSYWYFWHTTAPLGLCAILALAPEHDDAPRWRQAIARIAAQYAAMAARNPYGLIPCLWRSGEPDPDVQVDHNTPAGQRGRPWDTLPTRSGGTLPLSYSYFADFITNLDIACAALFLRQAARLLGQPAYTALAQRQLDWIIGCNPLDSSTIEAVGSNQPHRGLYGEFFPPTPQIPGAVMTGLLGDADDEVLPFEAAQSQHYGCYWLEYDAPPTGFVLWLMAELTGGAEH